MNIVPVATIDVQDFERDYLPRRAQFLAEARRTKDAATENPILALPYNRAILTHGVHIYANLLNFNDQLVEDGSETERTQKRAMQFLHLHYGACDRLIEAFELQRVDFHGGRLHAVVLTPAGRSREHERVAKGVAFANALRNLVARSNERFGGRYRTELRIGIDTGAAIAVNSGRRSEPEPLFIGSPANHAAHLAMGSEGGVFLSARCRQVLSTSTPLGAGSELLRLSPADELRFVAEARDQFSTYGSPFSTRVDVATAEYLEEIKQREIAYGQPSKFDFHHHTPPLSTIDFEEHPPSHAIRMNLGSIFADLDGFTRYVDASIGSGEVSQVVANLHVVRGEMAGTLRDDFGGRKVRFIGDCLHGIIAEGSSASTDEQETVESMLLAAGGIRSSFELCRTLLQDIDTLGLAIGVDLGWTPVCRIGLRGDASVRCATSRATCESENEQQDCSGTETAIGLAAYNAGKISVRRTFGQSRRLANFDYPAAVALLQGISAPATARVQAQPVRAHVK
jgi:class 3 adenylate cyclase